MASDPARPRPRASEEKHAEGGLLTAEQVGERFQVAVGHVYALARRGALPCVRVGRYVRFRREAIEEWEQAGGADA